MVAIISKGCSGCCRVVVVDVVGVVYYLLDDGADGDGDVDDDDDL